MTKFGERMLKSVREGRAIARGEVDPPKFKQKRKGSGSKAKGSEYERKICKLLSLWVTNGKKEDCFWRSSLSGGRATVAKKAGRDVRQAGDITAVAPEGHALTDHYYIECKSYKNLDIDSFILDGKGNLAKFWLETVKQANIHKREPILIAKENGRQSLIITSYGQPFSRFENKFIVGLTISTTHYAVHVMYLSKFLERPFK